jgi:methionine sulfoxide reductase heme-binding subunit
MLTFIKGFERERWMTHGILALITLSAVYAVKLWYAPRGELAYLITLGCGYLSLGLIALTLLIGPLKLVSQRRNPVNINLRRDVGIWVGITGILHVIFGLQLHQRGQILLYFFEPAQDGGWQPQLNLFGTSNYLGLMATVILIALLVTSNDLSLRKLKGKRWKILQRFNYALAGLVVVHTLAYQMVSRREEVFTTAVILLMVGVLLAQSVGLFLYHRWRLSHT